MPHAYRKRHDIGRQVPRHQRHHAPTRWRPTPGTTSRAHTAPRCTRCTARTRASRVAPGSEVVPACVALALAHVVAGPLAGLAAVGAAPAGGAGARAVLVVAVAHTVAVVGAGLVVVWRREARHWLLKEGRSRWGVEESLFYTCCCQPSMQQSGSCSHELFPRHTPRAPHTLLHHPRGLLAPVLGAPCRPSRPLPLPPPAPPLLR